MGKLLRANDVFQPNGIPGVTYVDRKEERLERLLLDAFSTPNVVVSVSGPSKTGKTVLITKTVDADNLIPVSGAAIEQPSDVWRHVLAWMESPTDVVTSKGSNTSVTANVSGGGKVKIPMIAEGGLETGIEGNHVRNSSQQSTVQSNYFGQVIGEIGGSDFVVFIDDFHYIPKSIQDEVARQIKSIAERGVRVCTASVPHRSDDVVRGNPELRGRLASIDSTYWTVEDLRRIAEQGFDALNLEVREGDISRLADEAFGSPQLMQTLCLNFCFEMDARERPSAKRNIAAGSEEIESVLVRSSMFSDYSSLLETLHSGPKQRGTERRIFGFTDGSDGDVYRSVLLALAHDPPTQTFRYDQVLSRVKAVCREDSPVGSSISESLRQMQVLTKKVAPDAEILEWDEDVLNVIEPYFLFYLRCSDKLRSLGDV